MKKKLWYTLLTVALIVVLAGALSVGALADDPEPTPTPSPDPGVSVFKGVNVEEDGTYTVDLEAFGTGTVIETDEVVPVDLILVLDVSGSMADNINTYGYTARNSQAYTYSNSNDYGDLYYKHTDGNYYQIDRGSYNTGYGYGATTHYYLYYTVSGTTYYLRGNSITTTLPGDVTNRDSTIWSGVLYRRGVVSSQSKIAALHDAVNGFLAVVAEKNADILENDPTASDEDLSRVAIVKFAGRSITNTNNWVDYNEINYGSYADHMGNDKYGSYNYNATQVVRDLTAVKEADLDAGDLNWYATINALTAAGATAADYGMGYANAIYTAHDDDYTDRQTVVVMFTDGEPNHGSGFNGTVANNAVNASKTMKDDGVKVYTIAVLEGADPSDTTSQVNGYLHGVSSNYPDATAYNSLGTRDKDDQGNDVNFYFSASSSDELSAIFTAIAKQSASPTSTVGKEAIMKDIVSSSFTLPEGASVDTIQVTVVPWDSTTHNWSETVKISPADWKTGCRNYGAKEDAEEDIVVTLSEDGKTIDITGFDYATHFRATNDPDKDKDGVNDQAAKLVITFPIQAKPSAVTGSEVATNGDKSGIYLNGDATEALIYFPVPQVVFTPVTYVVDYVTLPEEGKDNKPGTVKLDYSGVLADVQMLDDPSDDVLIGKTLELWDYTIYEGRFGTISFGEDEGEVLRRYVRYAPTTMNWNDYDRIFVKGKAVHQDPEHPEQELNVWAMLAVIPANSVYYEDSFVTDTRTATYSGQTVEIKYTGIQYDGPWETLGEQGANSTQHAEGDGIIMGWVDVMADDDTYSNDSLHVSNTANATATFTFSGTGVDIYSRTDNTTGTILVTLQDAESGGVVGFKIIDNKSAILDSQTTDSGAYYQIPTCTFADLEYGTYTVTIRVTAGAATQGRMTYYLDGVRVYNPIQPLEETDEVVQAQYGPTNLGAVFTEVRSLLCNGGAEAAAVFINEHTIEKEVEDSDAIDAAYAALQEAQAALDEWNATNQAVGEAQAAVYAAEDALASAKADLQAAVDARDALDPEDADAIAAANEAVANAQTAVTTAEGTLAAKKTALDSAYAAQADYNNTNQDTLLAAVAEANANYQDALDNPPVVPYTEATLADYTKEGPKSEVYLDKGESIAISVEDGNTYYLAMKEITGDGTTVKINGTNLVYRGVEGIQHTTDLYYDVTPANGGKTITVENTGDGILSITKLRTTGGDGKKDGTKAISTEQLFQAYKALYAAPATDYTGDVLTEDEATTVDPVDVTPADPADPVTEIELGEDDITIENAEGEPEAEPAEEPVSPSAAVSSLARLLESFFGFFRR